MSSYQIGSCELHDLFELIALQGGMLKAEQVSSLLTKHSLSFAELKDQLLPICEMFAIAPISQFKAGTIAQGVLQSSSSFDHPCNEPVANLYFGSNLEFQNQALSLVVHAEQAAINNAWQHGESAITGLTINAAPCGFCRQFINEIRDARQIPIQVAGTPCNLDQLLPEPFSPETLGIKDMLFDATRTALSFPDKSKVSKQLQTAIETSYAPYSKNLSACEIMTIDGRRFIGRYAENCAYSPSLSPMQSALSQMAMNGVDPNKHPIKKITLVELEGVANQLGVTKAVLQSLPFEIEFVHVEAKLA